jgi:hypothetical protein
MMAADEFFKSIIYSMELTSLSHDAARREGLDGDAAATRAEYLTANPTVGMHKAAVQVAVELTYAEKANWMGWISRHRQDTGPSGMLWTALFPFIRTPVNIYRAGLRLSPVTGIARMGMRAKAGTYEGGLQGSPQLLQDATEQLLALAALFAVGFGNDDDDPCITGAEQATAGASRRAEAKIRPAYSVRFGDTWVSYRRLEPFATGLAMLVDQTHAAKQIAEQGDWAGAARTLTRSVVGQLRDKTFLQTVGDIVRAVEDSMSGRMATPLASIPENFLAAMLVPNLVRNPLQAADQVARDWPNRQKGADWWREEAKRLAYRTVRMPQLPPRLDHWGNRVDIGYFENPAGDALYRMMVPARLQEAQDPSGVDMLLWRAHQQAEREGRRPWWPDNTLGLSMPDGKGGRKPMPVETAVKFQAERGRMFADLIPYSRLTYTAPTEKDVAMVQTAWEKAGQKARDRMGLR